MLVELFGPAGAGKTTFAHALIKRLRDHGLPAEVALSYVPGKTNGLPDPGGFVMSSWRILRAMAGMLCILLRPVTHTAEIGVAFALVRLLPPTQRLWLVRFSQYVLRLSVTWAAAAKKDAIVIFDQGFVQAVSSLALFHGEVDTETIAKALSLIPTSDLLVRVEAPSEIREARLRERLLGESATERLFEADLQRNLEASRVVDRVQSQLREQGYPMMIVQLVDMAAMEAALEAVTAEILRLARSASRTKHLRRDKCIVPARIAHRVNPHAEGRTEPALTGAVGGALFAGNIGEASN